MKNVSLIKISALVAVAALASNYVNANDEMLKAEAKLKAPIAKQVEFADLVAKLDVDKNGLLSQTEVSASNSKTLLQEFKKMDLNGDAQISEEEFNQYLAQVKNNKALTAKKAS